MLKKIINFFPTFLLLALLVMPYFVFAQNPTLDILKDAAVGNGGYAEADETSVASMAGTVVSAFLSLLGVIFLILMLYGGYNWMIAHGDDQKVSKAKDTIRAAIIGLVIVISAYAIYFFVWEKIMFS